MNLNSMKSRALSVTLAAALALGTFVPAAQADPDHGRGWGRTAVRGGPVVIERHSSSVGPALFGFIGGLVLGSVITQASQTYARPVATYSRYDYYDPYCDRTFDSFRDYDRHLERYDHPAVLDVMDRNSGQCVARYVERGDRWISVDPRDRGDYGYYDRGDRYGDQGYYRNDDRYRPDDRYVQPSNGDDDDDGGN